MRPAPPPSRARRTPARPFSAALALAALASLAAAAPAGAAHPFYEEQLRRGAAAFDAGDSAEAAAALRLASFGLLGEPPALAGCLVRLALARRELGDAAGAREAVERVLEIEERFGAYRAAALPEPLAVAFAELAAETVPAERLAALPGFQELARRRLEAELAELAPAARRRRLEELTAAEPGDPRWALLLGRIEFDDGGYARAAELAERVVAAEPAGQPGICLRGLARAGAGDCAGAAGDLAACDQSRTEAAVAITRLDCLAALARWDELLDAAAALPPALRANRQVVKLERRAAKSAPATAPAPATSDEAAAAPAGSGEPAGETAAAEVPGGEPPVEAAGAPHGDMAAEDAGNPSAAETPTEAPGDTLAAEDAAEDTSAAAPAAAAEAPPAAPPVPAPAVPAPEPAMSAEDAARLEFARTQLAGARTTDDLAEAWPVVRGLADRYPASTAAQHLAAEIAYRTSRWPESAYYYRRGGEPVRPERRFYYAVALYESGETAAAAEVLTRALPGLRRTPFVQSYLERILGPSTPP